jgi:hypothetical protein
MRISRWISIPLIFIAAYLLPKILFERSIDANDLLFFTISGAVVGFVLMLWNDATARRVCGTNDKEIYKVRQKRNLTLLLSYEKAFECCMEAVYKINPTKIKEENPESGVIKVRTPMKWDTFGHIITINLKKINQNLTKVEIRTRPIPRTIVSASGYSWKYVEDICHHLKERDAEINKKVLVESAQILDDVYVRPFQKEKIRL